MMERMVSEVINGDTFVVTDEIALEGKQYKKISVEGYHAPDLETEGEEAKNWLSELILGKTVKIEKIHAAIYQRLVCDVYICDQNLKEHYRRFKTRNFLNWRSNGKQNDDKVT